MESLQTITGQIMNALQHLYPQWETLEDDPIGQPREVWRGAMRIVRSRKRKRLLERRGVPLMHLGQGSRGTGPWAWFIECPDEFRL